MDLSLQSTFWIPVFFAQMLYNMSIFFSVPFHIRSSPTFIVSFMSAFYSGPVNKESIVQNHEIIVQKAHPEHLKNIIYKFISIHTNVYMCLVENLKNIVLLYYG